MTTMLGRLDDGSSSFADVYQLQNFPALVIYGSLFYVIMLLLAVGVGAAARRSKHSD
jgi:hypothetical protein